jgi:hypothetical protein
MATNTYVELAKITPSGSLTSIVMDSIPNTYTDLILVGQYSKSAANSVRLWLNNDTSSGLYSQTILYANGSTASSGRETNENAFYMMDYLSASTTTPHTAIIHIANYANTSVNKTILERGGTADKGTTAAVGLWRNTAAVTRIDVGAGSGTFSAGTTFSLYGIKAADVLQTSPKASGGYVYSDSSYWYHVFPTSSTFTPNQSLTADVLCVAGGGGGGTANRGGGGGAGGVIYFAGQSLTATGYTCTIGAGGNQFGQGNNSQFASLTVASGGGRGGASNFGGAYLATAGGSGGGNGNDGTNNGGASNQSSSGATAIYGNRGGNVTVGGDVAGGGGAGAAGTDGVNTNNGIAGGIGTNAFVSWLSATGLGQGGGYIAAGGNGGANYSGGGSLLATRPLGGGGGNSADLNIANGLASTGSGGSGFSYNSGSGTYPAGFGGSGLVIVRYAK